MNNQILLPNSYKRIGWFILSASAILGIFLLSKSFESLQLKSWMFAIASNEFFGNTDYFSFVQVNIVPTATGILFIVGCLLVGFSREKLEDEYIANIRLSSLLWAVLLNSLLLIFCLLFIWGTFALNVMMYNLFSTLLFFIIRFNYLIYKNNREASHE